jgi:hypothetical protein
MMILLFQARSNPLAWWWAFLSAVSALNIASWYWLYNELQPPVLSTAAPGVSAMLLLCAGYVFGCAFRSVLPRADVQRICLFDTWLSSVFVGRSVATVAELCFAIQWVIVLRQLGGAAGAETVLTLAWIALALIVIAECCSWYAVLTTNFLFNAIENSLWAIAFLLNGVALARLLPTFDGAAFWMVAAALIGIAGYLAFLGRVDVPMYLTRWREARAAGLALLHPLDGLRDVRTRWVVTHELAHWRGEIMWMSLYFSGAVWSSLVLCVVYATGPA